MKSEIRNPKCETNSKDQNPKSQTNPQIGASVSVIRAWDLFRVSDFVLRAYAGLICGLLLLSVVSAGDQAQWGQAFTRNMVSAETGLVDRFDPATDQNVK